MPGSLWYPLTHPDKIMYPEDGITKQNIADFYIFIQNWILPHIINRPLSLVRCPEDRAECFFQKHPVKIIPKGLFPITLKEKNSAQRYLYIQDIRGLMALVQMSALEIHVWGSQVHSPEKPDRMIFDLDPAPDVPWKKIIAAAKYLRKYLALLNLKCFVKTTGGKGLHVVVPIIPRYSWDEVKQFSRAFVESVVLKHPLLYVSTLKKSARHGKIFIDYLRNQRGATSIGTYSIRAKAHAPVAVPIGWHELTARLRPDTFNLKNLSKRLKALKQDPWNDFFQIKQSLPCDMEKNIMATQYGKSAQNEVKNEMHRFERGTAKSGKGGKGGTVQNRKQAIAIGLSKARKKGAKVPVRVSKST